MKINNFWWFFKICLFYEYIHPSSTRPLPCARTALAWHPPPQRTFRGPPSPSAHVRVVCIGELNVFVKYVNIKNHQKSWILIDFHWFSLIFGHFWTFLMISHEADALTWPAPHPMAWHPPSQCTFRGPAMAVRTCAGGLYWWAERICKICKIMKIIKNHEFSLIFHWFLVIFGYF